MLLTTKFLRQTPDPRAVRRQRLNSLLEPESGKRLNLVVAPAGYGKTTLVSQWCALHSRPTAWLSLDEQDNHPRQFWQYVLGAFEHAGLIGLDTAKNHLARTSGDDLTAVITSLVNTLNQDHSTWFLVLDDYHEITHAGIHRQLAWFIDYLPPETLVTIASRTEPPLPLPRWRVRRHVRDIHPGLLAFSEEECQAFFSHTMAMDLSEQDIRSICRRTEGWVAALQLSALSARSGKLTLQTPPAAPDLPPDSRLISDYVLSEVLRQLPGGQMDFLLDTAVCPRLCASLADYIRQRPDSQEQLAALLAQNLFLIPLDTRNEWFRYHDLFREALLQHVRSLDPRRADHNLLRAIDWQLSHGQVQEAIGLIVQRKDTARLARVLAEHGNNLIHSGFHLPVLDWLEYLPAEQVAASAKLQMLNVWALFFANRVDGLERLLTRIEDLLDRQVADSHPEAEDALALQSEISLIRSYLARSRNDNEHASDLTRQVLKDIDQIKIPLKSVTYYGLGMDYFGKGDLSQAEEALESAIYYGRIERKPSTVLSSGGLLAWIHYNRGDTGLALETTDRIRGWVDEHYADPSHPRLISCWQNSALVEIYRELDQTATAAGYLSPLLDHVEQGTEPGQHVVIQFVRGHLAFSEGRLDDAIDALNDAVAVAGRRRDHILFEPPAAEALLARCYLTAGQPDLARQALEPALASPASNPLNREQNQIALARVLLACGDCRQAQEVLSALIPVTERNAHTRHLVEVLLVYAQALLQQGHAEQAGDMLERALERAEPAGFLRLFAEESPDLQRALAQRPRLQAPGAWNEALRALLELTVRPQTNASRSPAQTPGHGLPEPLSQREQQVLELINQGLANKDIATRMSVAPATVKAHIRNLYGKLGVGRRTEALARARELGLLHE